jgi:ferric-dicitrate binding protein FerR (iron transport regulator)
MSQDADPTRKDGVGGERSRAEGRRMACEAILASRATEAGAMGDAVLERLRTGEASSRPPSANRSPALLFGSRAWIVWGSLAATIAVAVLAVLAHRAYDRGDTVGEVVGKQDEGGDARPASVGKVVSGTLKLRAEHADRFAEAAIGHGLASGDVLRAGGERPSEVSLSDEVKLVLDTGTEVVIAPDPLLPYDICLKSGRLFATVAEGTPFRVLTDEGNVKSLGTRFAVSLGEHVGEDGGLAVSVEEGVVQVARGGQVDVVNAGHCLLRGPGGRARVEGGESFRRQLGWVRRFRRRYRGGRSDQTSGKRQDRKEGRRERRRGRGRHGGQGRGFGGPHGNGPDHRDRPKGRNP